MGSKQTANDDGYEQLYKVDGSVTATWTRGKRDKYELASLWGSLGSAQPKFAEVNGDDARQSASAEVCHSTSQTHLCDDHEASRRRRHLQVSGGTHLFLKSGSLPIQTLYMY